MKIVVYDLPSENFKVINSDMNLRDKVRATRVWATERLHRLGVQCTMSVILVAPSREGLIESTIRDVKARYMGVKALLREHGIDLPFEPIIRVLPLTSEQEGALRELGARRVREVLDGAIERVSQIIDSIAAIIEGGKGRSTLYSVNRLENEMEDLVRRAREAGIDVTSDYQYLVELIDEVRRRLE